VTVADTQKFDREDALPWSVIGAGLAAMAALYCTRGRFDGLVIPAVALVASRLTTWRLPSGRVISWGIRLAILAVVLAMFRARSNVDATVWYLNEEDTKTAGYAFVAELVLRAWERHAPDRMRESRGAAIAMTALIFLAATHTFERIAIQCITPVYMIFVLLALRSFARIGQQKGVVRRSRAELVAMRAVVLLVSLGVALAGTSLVTRYEYQVTSWAVQMLNRKNTKSAEIGFSMDPRLGAVANPQPTMDRILLIDGPQTEQHLRVMAFDSYAQGRWLPTMSDRTYRPAVFAAMSGSALARRMQFKRVADTADLLPVPLEMQKIDAADPLDEDDFATLRDQREDDNQSYEVSVPTAPAFQGPLCVEPDAAQRKRLLAVPSEIDPRVIELARHIAGDGDKGRQLFRIQSSLQKLHAYSLTFNPQGEPLNDFILNNRSAHCQYFASAVVVMARAVGIPARFVSGFYAHERYGSDRMVVRSRDAHAWAECWIEGVGWLTVDATPAGGRPDEIYPDPPAWRRWWEKLTDLPEQIRAWAAAPGQRSKLLALIVAIVVSSGYILREILRRRRQPKSVLGGYPEPSEELLALKKRFENWLRLRSMGCPPQLTWMDHLSVETAQADSLLFVRTYNQARFGGDRSSVERAAELLQQLEGNK
jgi:hypothetical protein